MSNQKQISGILTQRLQAFANLDTHVLTTNRDNPVQGSVSDASPPCPMLPNLPAPTAIVEHKLAAGGQDRTYSLTARRCVPAQLEARAIASSPHMTQLFHLTKFDGLKSQGTSKSFRLF